MRLARLGVDAVDAVVGHVGDEQPVARIDRQIVDRRLHRGDQRLLPRTGLHPHHLAQRGVDDVEIAFGIEVDGGRHLEAAGHRRHGALVDIDLDHLPLEPERPVEHAVGAELEAVQPAHAFHHLARRLGCGVGRRVRLERRCVDLPKRVAQEHLGREQPAVLGEGQRVDAGQASGELPDRLVRLGSRMDDAGQERSPRHGAVGAERDIVGHAFGRRHHGFDLAGLDLHLVERLADDAAGEELVVAIEAQPVHTVEMRTGHQELRHVGFRRRRRRRWLLLRPGEWRCERECRGHGQGNGAVVECGATRRAHGVSSGFRRLPAMLGPRGPQVHPASGPFSVRHADVSAPGTGRFRVSA